MLKTIGDGLTIENNGELDSFNAPELVLINGDLDMMNNLFLWSLKMTKLDLITGDVNINGGNNYGEGVLSMTDFSSTEVSGDVNLKSLAGAEIDFGVLNGDLTVNETQIVSLSLQNETFYGNMTLTNNKGDFNLSFSALTTVNGNITMRSNYGAGGGVGVGSSSTTATTEGASLDFSCFDLVTYIGGNVDIQDHKFSELEAFNAVQQVAGGNIYMRDNGPESVLINVFNSLTTGTGGNNDTLNITIYEKTGWWSGFAALEKASNVQVDLFRTFSSVTYEEGTSTKFDGFESLTTIGTKLTMDLYYVTEFNAFPALVGIGNYNSYTQKYGPGNKYLDIWLPESPSVTLCSLMPLVENMNDMVINYDSYSYPWIEGGSMDIGTFIGVMFGNCGGGGIGSF